ncbi:MAG TPA: DNA (cytosine-5-)-methyltransferase [Vulgatibacter sp.]|nr:DNA (cytosine-5-)-methyltransferase [Vulgatibacter sp.]
MSVGKGSNEAMGGSVPDAPPPLLRLIENARAYPRRSLKVAGLFAGIGGLELGLEQEGHEASMFCEIEPSAQAVLRARFPGIPLESDVCELKELPKGTDLLAGGFPCQDLSQAGKTAGIEGSRSGLVGEVFRLLRKRPTPWVLLENVPFMLRLSKGRALEVIVAALEDLGYRWAYRVVDTRAFGLPQRRERVFMLASLTEDPRAVLFADEAGEPPAVAWNRRKMAFGFYWTEGIRGLGAGIDCVPTLKGGSTIGIPSSPGILLPSGRVVTPDIRDAERLQGFPADWTLPAEEVSKRGSRWKLVGNAVTVDAARWLGYRLAVPGKYDGAGDAPLAVGDPWPKAAWNMGEGRHVANLSAYPLRIEAEPLHRFLQYPTKDLSLRATSGFLARTRKGSLRFPEGFLEAVEEHLAKMEGKVLSA